MLDLLVTGSVERAWRGYHGQMEGIGEAVATERKLAGLTQLQLAQRSHVSVSLVRSVEQGRVPASPAFVAAVARVLGTSAADLQGQPAKSRTPDDHRVRSVIPALRRELVSYMLPGVEGVEPRPLEAVRSAVRDVSARRQSVELVSLGEELPGLLAEIRTIVTREPDNKEAYSLLALTYAAAGQVAYKLGYSDLATLTTDRVEWAARRSEDELAIAAGDFYRAGELIAATEWTPARTYLEGARDRIEHLLDEEPGLAMYGLLHLKSGLAAARQGDKSSTNDHIGEARAAAARVAEFRNDYDLSFNRHSVAIWSVGLAVELMDGTTAVERASKVVIPREVSTERAGHHYIDLARGFLLHGDKSGAFNSLQTARRIAPQQTRYHPQVLETARMLARAERRRSDTLANFVEWLGVAS